MGEIYRILFLLVCDLNAFAYSVKNYKISDEGG
jgi:hypothetical protein